MNIEFTKMHGLGNDFVVIDAIRQSINLTTDNIRLIANRHLGIGCDQLLLVEKSDDKNADFIYRIFNADGGEVEQCGNGARCFALFVRDKGLINKDIIKVQTKAGIMQLTIDSDKLITVDVGVPELEPDKIPFQAKSQMNSYNLDIDGKEVTLSAVSMGNPHAVLIVDNIEIAPVSTLGAQLEGSSFFPNRTNVGFMQINARNSINLRVYERGAGETQACGSGACAAVVAGRLLGLLDETVEVKLIGGILKIQWPGENQTLHMTGPATTVYEGHLTL